MFNKILFAVGVMLSLSTQLSAAILYESGTLGPTGVTWQQAIDGDVPGENVNPNAFSGVRFELTQPVMTTRIGGHVVGPPNSGATFFAAIVALDGENDFPDSNDLSTADLLGSTVIEFPEPSAEVFGNLSLSLDPGWYALIFGSGLLGAQGSGGVLSNSLDIGNPDYIGFLTGFGWGNRLPSKRFVIEGIIVPEPTSATTVLLLSLFSLFHSRQEKDRHNLNLQAGGRFTK
jgi:hypothetical protein